MSATAYSQIGQIASMRRVHEAFQWLHLHEPQIMRWQLELVSIPAPPFAERARAAWLLERFVEIGLIDVHLDAAGNVLALLPGSLAAHEAPNLTLISAHIDTVFPAHTPLDPVLEGNRLASPGACDNGAGAVALLALAAALTRAGIAPEGDILFAGNVGEEGEGDLRGMRYLYSSDPWRGRIAAHLVLDGAGHEVAVTTALGSRRFEVVVDGSGGHSWSDAERPNPIVALSEAIATMNRLNLREPAASIGRRAPRNNPELARDLRPEPGIEPRIEGRQQADLRIHQILHGESAQAGSALAGSSLEEPVRSTWNVGLIEGGGSVNAIPEQARARFDLRSTDPAQLMRLEVELYRAIEDAVLAANSAAEALGVNKHPLRFTIASIGSRPAGGLAEGARILELLRAVDRHLNLRTELRTASTDANIPLSLGVEAISMGAGGDGGGIHTRGEWYDARGRDLGLRRVLLLLLALSGRAEQAVAAD